MPASHLLVHVEGDLFDEVTEQTFERRGIAADGRKQKDGKKRKSKTAAFLSDFRDLKVGDFVVHVFEEKARRFYDLERLWREASRLNLSADDLAQLGSLREE